MKHLLVTLFTILALNSISQQTYVPDDNFEAHLEGNGMGNGIPNDDYVTTANISGVTGLLVSSLSILDLTGIEDFTALENLHCSNNQLTSLDVTQNTALTHLYCDANELTSLNVSQNLDLILLSCIFNEINTLDLLQNPALTVLRCSDNFLTSLDVSQNNALNTFYCFNNQITSLDVSQNIELTSFVCANNQLTYLDVSQNPDLIEFYASSNLLKCLNVKNGNNNILLSFGSHTNPDLTCIEVDDVVWSSANWTVAGLSIDPQMFFSTACVSPCAVGIEELNNAPKQILKIVDLMGRETTYKPNMALIYMYSDGTAEKVFRRED